MNLALVFLLFTASAQAKSIFIPENGNYVHTIESITAHYKRLGVDWVTLNPKKVIPGATYKILPNQNEYRMKNWYLQDWYELQDMFTFDPRAYMEKFGGETLNEAKRNQYGKFPFNFKKSFHKKSMPSLSEWGGLTHPPVKRLTMPLEAYDKNFAPLDYSRTESPYFSPGLQLEIDRVSGSELTFGNVLDVLEDREAFEAKKRLIKKAKKTIFMSSLAFACDASATEIVELLIQKHREGVDVRVIADGTISKLLSYSECPQMLKRAGVQIIRTKDFLRYKKKSIYHSKVLVTDLTEAISGGHNMLDADNLSRGVDFKNRDLDLYMKGPMATDVAQQFTENWDYHFSLQGEPKRLTSTQNHREEIAKQLDSERSLGVRGVEHYQRILSRPDSRMNGVCRFIKQNPWQDGHSITKTYLLLLDHVESYLGIMDPIKSDTFTGSRRDAPLIEKWDSFEYFNLLHNKVQDYLRSGKKLDYITTSMNMSGNENVAIMNEAIEEDLEKKNSLAANFHLGLLHLSNWFYGRPHFKNLIRDYVPYENAHVWNHISFVHSKVFYFDRVMVSLGSLNFQHNATDQAYESTALCMDEKTNREMDRIFVQDMANSMPLVFSK